MWVGKLIKLKIKYENTFNDKLKMLDEANIKAK